MIILLFVGFFIYLLYAKFVCDIVIKYRGTEGLSMLIALFFALLPLIIVLQLNYEKLT